ncbi:MAG: hypothetical protein JM58_06460 [Peptococcaceae bacterium BICA1-8]|nr:MAG: hypothetical protein JM58_06460 [Peptococcaceae bacterium BICA1-8]
MSILVTGGAGYIGSHTVKQLREKGYEVVVYDSIEDGHEEAVFDTTLVVGSILDEIKLDETIKKYKIEDVIHFAAYSIVGESIVCPQKYYRNNVLGTLSLLDSMIRNNIKKIVFSSTAAVYGEPERLPIVEESCKNPTNVYGKTKLMIENIMEDYHKAYGLQYVSLRYFNASGADPSGLIGEDHHPETHLIPIIFETLLGKREYLSIFGTDYNTPDGTCIRDYIHVNDLGKAHILALEALSNKLDSGIYNLGNGNGFSIHEVIQSVERVTGQKVPLREEGRRVGDPAMLIASADRAKKDLNWYPDYTKLDDIIETAWEWHRKNKWGFQRRKNK